MRPEVRALIEHYNLEPLPVEQTLFVRTYRSSCEFGGGKPCGTAIIALYCDEPRSVSLFHKLPVDEVWHFYGGDPLRLVLLYPDGSSKDVIMGNDLPKGHHVQFVVPAGVWQAGHMLAGGIYSLYGCTLAPGFTDDMFEGGTRDQLVDIYPDRLDDINMLCCSPGQTGMPEGSAS
ncbi:MAG: cupin domain-containing protein [Gammaproteobacteria bacterium]|nr:cupin domain-containing protein [Gammaproteobacteria bacterium]